MRYVPEQKALRIRGVDWEELAGPFKTLVDAVAYCEEPPADLGDAGVVTVMLQDHRSSYPFYVFRATRRRNDG